MAFMNAFGEKLYIWKDLWFPGEILLGLLSLGKRGFGRREFN